MQNAVYVYAMIYIVLSISIKLEVVSKPQMRF